MHVLYLSNHFSQSLQSPEELLTSYYSIRDWCNAIKSAGMEQVTVVQRFKENIQFEDKGVRYHFFKDNFGEKIDWFDNPVELHKFVTNLKPDIIHSQGFPFHLRKLRRMLPEATTIIWQDHGGSSPRWYRHKMYEHGFKVVDAFFYTNSEQAKFWQKKNVITSSQLIFDVPESSSHFTPLLQENCRKHLSISGNPIYLWVGRLNSNKDPLTVVDGFNHIKKEQPEASLYIIYSEADLLDEVQKRIKKMSLENSIFMIGKKPHRDLQQFYSAADYFILGSHHEGSGYALLEALACGLPAIVTGIPSFKTITGNGTAGFLWTPGNVQSLIEAMRSASKRKITREQVRTFFDKHLSFASLGATANEKYRAAYHHRQLQLAK